MATRKGVELRTDFTGSDKNFQPVLNGLKGASKSLARMQKKQERKDQEDLINLRKNLSK